MWIAGFHYHRDRTRTVPDGLTPIPTGFTANRSVPGQARPLGGKDHASLRTIRGSLPKMLDFVASPDLPPDRGAYRFSLSPKAHSGSDRNA
jgi:hypothetical protein